MRALPFKRQRGFALYITTLMLLMIIPMIGLAIDASLLYVVKTRLQGAVDGAALAGAKALSHGTDSATELTAANLAAETYVKLNYPSSFFFSNDVVLAPSTAPTPGVQIDESVAYQRTVTVTASVLEPTLFMRWLNFMSTTVTATASTVRKDVNIMMVMDRSGSLQASGSCAPLIAAAQNFVGQFSPGNDNVGLVTFASTTYLNYPPSTNFSSASPNVVTMLGNIACSGSTSTANGLWMGYQQLIALNETAALNVILLFTDGDPTAGTFNMPVAKTSPCTAYTSGSPTGAGGYTLPSTAHGYITGLWNSFTGVSPQSFFGLLNGSDPNAPSGGEQVSTNGDNYFAPNSTGCSYYSGTPVNSNQCITSDFTGLPLTDIYGNSTNTSYQAVTTNATGMVDLGAGGTGCPAVSNATAVALNIADSAATRIRSGTTDPVSGKSLSNVIIFSIGLGNAAVPFSPTFLERVSNDPRSPIYNSSEPAGLYVYAATSADLQSAFAAVASEILRLAK
jgi:Flp pilus assembly protein TadG